MSSPGDAVLLRAPELLERAVGYTRGCLQHVRTSSLDSPTPCAGWDLRALLLHMDDSLEAFTEAAATGYVDPLPATRHRTDALLERLRIRACALMSAWAHEPVAAQVSVGGRRLDTDLVAAAGALEIAVHGWDVARACGADRPIPPGLAEQLRRVVPWVVTPTDRPSRFGQPVDVPPDATAGDRLLASLGRFPR
jgi:uncharacterized protein (TIGR03086 family)